MCRVGSDEGRANGSIAAALLFAGVGMVGCSAESDRPPSRPSCTADECGVPPGSGISASGGGTGSGGQGGSSGDELVTLTGSILQHTEDQFLQPSSFTGPGLLEAFGPNGSLREGTFVDGTFTLPDVRASQSLWVLARPASEALHFPTWTFVNASSDVQVSVPVVLRSVIEEIMNAITVPAVPLQGTAQVVLRVLDANRAPLEGVTVAAPAAQLVIYGALGTWSETEVGTDPTGLVVLGNVSASAVPGNELEITLGGAGSGSFVLRVANDTLTFVHLVLP